MASSRDGSRECSESVGELFRTFLRIGLLSFGGPAAQISVMHRILVDEKNWLGETQFLHALNFCMLLPGPEAMQLATYSGWLLRGVRGGLTAGLLFVLPGLAMMLALSAIFVFYGDVPAIAGLMYGLKAAVLAVVAAALAKVAQKALKTLFMIAVAICAFVAIAMLKAPFPLIVIGAGILGGIIAQIAPQMLGISVGDQDDDGRSKQQRTSPAKTNTPKTVFYWLTIWFVPLLGFVVFFGQGHVFADAALFFSKTAVVTFGGAYAVLAYVGQQAVEFYGWLQPDEMLAGLGLAETTLGPLVLVLVFTGFVGGAGLEGWHPMAGGLAGGLIAAFFTFVPCFFWIFAGAPYVEALRGVRWLAAGLRTITAAVVGVIANLAVWFALHVLFGDYAEWRFGPLYLPDPNWLNLDFFALGIGIASGIALIGLRMNMMPVLAGAALAGFALSTV